MTDKQIIKEKGNQKCIFYNDDICRKGDKTRDCLNCARVEYHSLYKLNWENQERLEFQLERNEQQVKEVETLVMDNDRLINELNQLKQSLMGIKNIVDTCNSGINCAECPYTEQCRTDIEAEALGVCNLILQKFEGLNE